MVSRLASTRPWAGLRRLDPQLAGLYELGLKLANEIERPGFAHALAYVGRELSRGVIRRRLQDEGIDEPGQEAAAAGCPADGQRNRQRIAAALQLPEDDPRVTQWLGMPARFAAWQKYRYGGPSPDDVREGFEQFLRYALRSWLPRTTRPRRSSTTCLKWIRRRRAREASSRPSASPRTAKVLFERLKDPQWVAHLSHEGFFANPPGREVHEDGLGARAGGRRATTSLRSPHGPCGCRGESYWPSHQLTTTPASGTRSPEQPHGCRWMWRST